jgi:polyhydroxybutyrate depolymerase
LALLLLALSAASGPAAWAETAAGQPVPGNFAVQEIEHDGLARTYYLRLPAGYGGSGPYPVVFVLHGGGGSAQIMMRMWGRGFNGLADARGIILVYPEGISDEAGGTKYHWNDGREGLNWAAHQRVIDDVGFISKVIDRVVGQYRGDPKRIFVTGASNGGLMSYRLACDLSEKVRAVAAMIANLAPELSGCRPAKPISVLIMNGTEDPLMPYQGGEITFGRVKLGKVLSAPETAQFWATRNGLAGPPETSLEPDKDPQDGTRVRRERYPAGANKAEVVFYTIEGGGHTTPGGLQYLPERLIGRTSRDFDAGEVIINFFLRQQNR